MLLCWNAHLENGLQEFHQEEVCNTKNCSPLNETSKVLAEQMLIKWQNEMK